MQFIHESGKYIINGIIEVNADNAPVSVILKWGETRLFHKDRRGYWFKYRNIKFYFDKLKLVAEERYLKIHVKQCLRCVRLRPETNRCLSPGGYRSFKGYTKQNCRYFEE
jgi:hypothetical protein